MTGDTDIMPTAILKVVPQFGLEVVEHRDCAKRCDEVVTSTAMVSQDPPVLQPRDGVLHACTAMPMASPDLVANDAIALEPGRRKFGNATVAAVGEHLTVT